MSSPSDSPTPPSGPGSEVPGLGVTGPADNGLASEHDATCVRQVLAGDREAFTPLVERHQRKALAVSYRLLGNMHDATEVVQDAFLKAYRSLDMLQDVRLFGPWFLRIVANYSLNYRRGRKRVPGLPLDDMLSSSESGDATPMGEHSASPLDAPAASELSQKVQRAMNQLPERQRMALVLFSIENMPQKEVADVLECSVEAVKWYVFQARKKLKELLADELTEA